MKILYCIMRNLPGVKREEVLDSGAWSSGNRGVMVIFTPGRYDVSRHSAISIEYASDFGCIPESAINFQSIIASLSDAKSSAKDIIVLSVLSRVNFSVTHPSSLLFDFQRFANRDLAKGDALWLGLILSAILLNRR